MYEDRTYRIKPKQVLLYLSMDYKDISRQRGK